MTNDQCARTYRYTVAADGFDLRLLAIWIDEDTPTAQIRVETITPDDERAYRALQRWIEAALKHGGRPTREAFDHLSI